AETYPAAVGRDLETGDADRSVAREARRAHRVEIQCPETREWRLGIPDVHRELLLATLLLSRVDRVRGDEVDTTTVARQLPAADTGRLLRQLFGLDFLRRRTRNRRDRQTVELLLTALAGTVHQPVAVAREREVRDTVLCRRDPARLAAVRTHQVELALAAVVRRVTVRRKDKKAAITRPRRRRFVLLRRERHRRRG